ncbi:MAG: bifunctional DNA-formamidopyrimidine glycosylase/DNA-(apurinic or apyrimidinic site) lyase [Dehalococcoidia bacterium]|nr:bifunctional DNA-formamidopyrimidine glycosylase/DNA-(apurinic or apyrimidinic site) lyase [Dehalococcoidia bacterium]
MPELPEVETIRRDLTTRIVGRSFAAVTLNWPKMVQIPSPEAFSHRLVGQCIRELDRRGKYLILRLASGETLILHLMMSGSLLLDPQGDPDPYSRAVFLLDDGAHLHFRDPRKLGKMWLVEDESMVLGRLGPEPLSPGFTAEVLRERVKKRSAPIKAVLCDQSFLAGVGNMYADEALFAAGIHPLRTAMSLSTEEIAQLHRALHQVLQEAIGSHGASISSGTWWRPDGQIGTAQIVFKVAHSSFQPCPVCATPIERIPIRGRGTYFCPNCQRKSP